MCYIFINGLIHFHSSLWCIYKAHFILHFYFPITKETVCTTVFQAIAIPTITSFAIKSTKKLGTCISYMFISKVLISKCLISVGTEVADPPHGSRSCVPIFPSPPSHLLVLLGFVPSFFSILNKIFNLNYHNIVN